MAAMNKRSALGRGLDALIDMGEIETSGTSSINEIELSRIQPNPDQPRREFDEQSLEELAASIREIGIVQPISLRQQANGSYQIIAGERRYRAAHLAGLSTIPAYIRTVEDEAVMEMALIENIQREDLNAIEIALSFKKLIGQYNLTQKLPAEVQIGLRDKLIDMGHARALLSVENASVQLELYKAIISEGLSVRKVEELARNMAQAPAKEAKKVARSSAQRQEYNLLRNHLSNFFGLKVQFTCDDKGKGKIGIPFKNEEELERIIALLDKLK